MTLEIGKEYTFRYRSGLEVRGLVLDIISHPDLDPVYKLEVNGQIRLVRSTRLTEIPTTHEEPELTVLVPTRSPEVTERSGAVLTRWWSSLKARFKRQHE